MKLGKSSTGSALKMYHFTDYGNPDKSGQLSSLMVREVKEGGRAGEISTVRKTAQYNRCMDTAHGSSGLIHSCIQHGQGQGFSTKSV
jgi:hypothetical protein